MAAFITCSPVASTGTVRWSFIPSRSSFSSRFRIPCTIAKKNTRRRNSVVQNAISEPETKDDDKTTTYNGALFPGVEISRDSSNEALLKKFSKIFPWGNGAPVTEKVLFDLLKDEVRSAPLFVPLYQYYRDYGGVYNLGAGPKWFVVVSDPTVVKFMFKDNADTFSKGILTDIMQPIMGDGLIPANRELWAKRRPVVGSAFHGTWLKHMTDLFGRSAMNLSKKLENHGETDEIEIENELYSMALDVIGEAVFNYEFGALNEETPIIKAVYRVLRESEHRSTFPLPYWQIPGAMEAVPRQKQFSEDIEMINAELTKLIREALENKQEVDLSEFESRDYNNVSDASLLRFLVDIRGDEASDRQLRDDLMTMLIAGHETTAAVLTWTIFCLCKHPDVMEKAAKTIDEIVQDPNGIPTVEEIRKLRDVRMCLMEGMRLYPAPPILIRRAIETVDLPKGGMGKSIQLKKGTDCFVAVWNLHRSPDHWENPNLFDPSRWDRKFTNPKIEGWNGYDPELVTGLYPNEVATDYAYIPFGGGQRRCAGDVFAMMEATVALSVLLKKFSFELACDESDVEMITGATIHTKKGLPVRAVRRKA